MNFAWQLPTPSQRGKRRERGTCRQSLLSSLSHNPYNPSPPMLFLPPPFSHTSLSFPIRFHISSTPPFFRQSPPPLLLSYHPLPSLTGSMVTRMRVAVMTSLSSDVRACILFTKLFAKASVSECWIGSGF